MITPRLLDWADIIFCIEKKHVRRIRETYSGIMVDKKVVFLNITDDYAFIDADLCELLGAIVPEYI